VEASESDAGGAGVAGLGAGRGGPGGLGVAVSGRRGRAIPLRRLAGGSPARAEGVKDAPAWRAAARWPQAILDPLRPAGKLACMAMKGKMCPAGDY